MKRCKGHLVLRFPFPSRFPFWSLLLLLALSSFLVLLVVDDVVLGFLQDAVFVFLLCLFLRVLVGLSVLDFPHGLVSERLLLKTNSKMKIWAKSPKMMKEEKEQETSGLPMSSVHQLVLNQVKQALWEKDLEKLEKKLRTLWKKDLMKLEI